MPDRSPIRSLAPILVLGLSVLACGDDPAEPIGEPPELPPLASMQVEASLFDDVHTVQGSTAPFQESHFLTATVAVTLARAVTIVVMAVPVATFAAAASNTPVFENDAFHWRYSVQANGQTFEADLSGRGEGTESIWEMRITSSATSPPLDDFLWYSGRAALSGQAGEWHVFSAQQPSPGTEVLDIDWAHPSEDHWILTFTNVNPNAAETGDRLEYEVDGDVRVVRHLDSSAGAVTEISWNSATRAGYIQAPGYNGGERGCWDDAFANVACSFATAGGS